MKRNGFTLIELMIVVAIIGILAVIAIPNFLKFRCRAYAKEVGITNNEIIETVCEECMTGCNNMTMNEAVNQARGRPLEDIVGNKTLPGKPAACDVACAKEKKRIKQLEAKVGELENRLSVCQPLKPESNTSGSWKN